MTIRVTVCELRNDPDKLLQDWERLVEHLKAESSQVVLLPEMPFAPWFPAQRTFNMTVWRNAVEAHDRWQVRLNELAPAIVIGTRPVNVGNKRLNEGFVWTQKHGYRVVHHKYYLPDEEGYWEATWYESGDGDFTPLEVDNLRFGMLICTEIWFMERARVYGKQGVHFIVTPRATPTESLDKWLAGGRCNAVVAGAFSLSSGLFKPGDPETDLGGQGWIINPEGHVLGTTSQKYPFVTVAIDLDEAEHAKYTYPRYVRD